MRRLKELLFRPRNPFRTALWLIVTIWLLMAIADGASREFGMFLTICFVVVLMMEAIIWQLRHGKWDIDLKVGMMQGPPMNIEKQEKEH